MRIHNRGSCCARSADSSAKRRAARRKAPFKARHLATEQLEERRLLAGDSAFAVNPIAAATAAEVVTQSASPAVSFQLTHAFSGNVNTGAYPYAGLTLVGSTLFGMTEGGGTADSGTIFSMNADGSNYQLLHSFTGTATDGSYPYGNLTAIGSTLYGTTYSGGSAGEGIVFSIGTGGTNFTLLHSFTGSTTDGAYPYASLNNIGSTLYGTTNNGGTGNEGTVFSLSTSGTSFQVLHSFTGTTSDGAYPYAGLTAIGSVLYGTTDNGGSAGNGTIFSVSTTGTGFQLLHSFTGATNDGAIPDSVLTLINSTFYGTTDEGGTANKGTVFSISTAGTGFQVLHSFTESTTDGAYPKVGVIASGSTLYGTTVNGGTADNGTVFSLSTSGTNFQLLHSFAGTADGALPFGGLVLIGSTLYGTTNGGGSGPNTGTVFSVGTTGTGFQVVHTFVVGAVDGAYPYATLTLIGSTFYGTTNSGGTSNVGAIFSINTDGSNFTVLHSFTGGTTDGSYPYASLTAIGSTLYGTTNNGGTANEGTVFSISTSGANFQLLHSFTGTTSDGAYPYAGLTVLGSVLYGTTNNGGTAGNGTLYSINTAGTGFQLLHSFTGTTSDGAIPDSVLTLINSTFYGTTDEGGTVNKGTVFSISTAGTGFQVLHSFTESTTDGAFPRVGVIASGSTLYGTTINGGTADNGTVFSLSTSGTGFQLLHSFAGTTDGALPFGGLVLVGSTLYGTTNGGGSGPNNGTVFSVSTTGTGYQVLHTFSGGAADGSYPYASLAVAGSTLYGTTNGGGTSDGGTVFAITVTAADGPQVTGISVDGTSWATSFDSALKTAGQGNGTGYSIPVGSAAQLKDLGWTGTNQIQIQFNENVNVQQNSLVVTGLSGQYSFAGFVYNSTTHTATWTLSTAIGADKVSLDLKSTGASAVTDGSSNPLDGDWVNGASTYPSGDGTAGGDFNFAFNVLPADINQDGIVNSQDLALVSSAWMHASTSADVNADGIVNSQDLAVVASSWLRALPTSSAGSATAIANGATAQGQSVATDAVTSDASPATALSVTARTVTTQQAELASNSPPSALGTQGPLNEVHSTRTAAGLALNYFSSLTEASEPTVGHDGTIDSRQAARGLSSSLAMTPTTLNKASSNPLPFDHVGTSWRHATSGLDVSSLDQLMTQSIGIDDDSYDLERSLTPELRAHEASIERDLIRVSGTGSGNVYGIVAAMCYSPMVGFRDQLRFFDSVFARLLAGLLAQPVPGPSRSAFGRPGFGGHVRTRCTGRE